MTAFVDLLAEVVLGRLLQLLQDHGGDLGRGVELAADRDADVAVAAPRRPCRGPSSALRSTSANLPAHEALDREDGVLGVGDGLALGHLAHEALAVLAEGDDGGGRAAPSALAMTAGLVAFQDGDHRVRRSQIDSDYLAHALPPAFRAGRLCPSAGEIIGSDLAFVKH